MTDQTPIAQQKRLHTYERLVGQSDAVIREALNLKPDEDPQTELARLAKPLERVPDPPPDVRAIPREPVGIKGPRSPEQVERCVADLLTEYHWNGEPLPVVADLAQRFGTCRTYISEAIGRFQREGRLKLGYQSYDGRVRRYVAEWVVE